MNSPNNNTYNLFFSKIFKTTLLLLIIGFFEIFGFAQDIDPDGYNTFYYENGQISSEGYFKNGLPHGLWKSYYPNGNLKSLGKKLNGTSDSTWVFYDQKGRIAWSYEYVNDKKNGCAIQYDTLGHKQQEIFYVNDVLQGERIEFYPSGKIKSTVNIVDGKNVGQLTEYNEKGEIITEEIYDNGFLKDRQELNRYDDNGEKTGLWRTYYPDGTIKSEGDYVDGKKNGVFKEFDKKGKLVDIKQMMGDTTMSSSSEIVIIELYKSYHPNGKIKLVGGINNGLKSGIYREFDENGELINGYIYKKDTMLAEGKILPNGQYDGAWKEYYPDGKIMLTGTYENGKRNGLWTYYYPNGKKEQSGKYVDGTPYGQWYWYYSNGQVKREEMFNARGLSDGTMTEYDSLGKVLAIGRFYNGEREGSWFYHVGDYKEEGEFMLGEKNGVWRSYYLNGKIAFVGVYDEGEPKGKHTYYHDNGIKKMQGKYVGGEKHGMWRTFNRNGEIIETIQYKRGEVYKINGFRIIETEEST